MNDFERCIRTFNEELFLPLDRVFDGVEWTVI